MLSDIISCNLVGSGHLSSVTCGLSNYAQDTLFTVYALTNSGITEGETYTIVSGDLQYTKLNVFVDTFFRYLKAQITIHMSHCQILLLLPCNDQNLQKLNQNPPYGARCKLGGSLWSFSWLCQKVNKIKVEGYWHRATATKQLNFKMILQNCR